MQQVLRTIVVDDACMLLGRLELPMWVERLIWKKFVPDVMTWSRSSQWMCGGSLCEVSLGRGGCLGRKHPVNLCRLWSVSPRGLESAGLGQSCGSMGLASRNNLPKMTTDNANRSNAARRTKATTKTGLVSLLVLCLLTEGYAKTTLNLPTRWGTMLWIWCQYLNYVVSS